MIRARVRALLDEVAAGRATVDQALTQEGSGFEQVTLDHSLLQELVDRGFYSPEEALRAANKNYVTRALGVEPSVDVEVQEHPAQKGDIYMICSDGLSGPVTDEMMLEILSSGGDLKGMATKLIARANEKGGPDNITVVLARWSA